MTTTETRTKRRFIEAGFPCHQVGAETQRERDTGTAPPTHRLHVWWARRPLTPSRAAILGSLLPEDTEPDWFLRQLGIEQTQAIVNGEPWVLTGRILDRVSAMVDSSGAIQVDSVIARAVEAEQSRRARRREVIHKILTADPMLERDNVMQEWAQSSTALPDPLPMIGGKLSIRTVAANPAHVNERIDFAKSDRVKTILGEGLRWEAEELYGYGRAYNCRPEEALDTLTILDPTSGGGSIPFEALRLGHRVIANDLNPVASVILHGTLLYPAQFGDTLVKAIRKWGNQLVEFISHATASIFPFSELPKAETEHLKYHCRKCSDIASAFLVPEYDQTGLLFCRQVTCPHCGGEAPLLNTCWLSKSGDKWGVRIIPGGRKQGGSVHFETYRVKGDRGPEGENPDFATVDGGVGTCIHCRQAISSEEIKSQARGESPYGAWKDRLYCVVAVRHQPKLDASGQPIRYRSGANAGEIRTEKVTFFRPPNQQDLDAIDQAQRMLEEKWDEWDRKGLIPTEAIPQGHKTLEPLRAGMARWCDMFTPRQLLGHVTLIEELNRLKPEILRELGQERGRAVVTYLQFMIDKGLDYNSRQTRWEYTRGVVKGTFGRHDFSLKWTFGEMIFTGPNSGAAWGLSQVVEAYAGIAELVHPVHVATNGNPPVSIRCRTAANTGLEDQSVDLVCMDPPYYNNVQYAELSDYFYVWQKRTLQDLYPELFSRRLTNKADEAVANPARDGSAKESKKVYEGLMMEIFRESSRVLKTDGVMTLMFTHKKQEAWEALTRSLIDSSWIISSTFPVDSESSESTHTKDNASAESSIFITCRKRTDPQGEGGSWSGFGGGVAMGIREAVREGLREFEPLHLNPVDEMVASYGRALQVLSQHWPVLDGDELVSPLRAMNEASAVVAQHQVSRITNGGLRVEDLAPESAMSLTLFGIFGLSEIPYDDALSLSRSLNISLEAKTGGYQIQGRMTGFNTEVRGRQARQLSDEDAKYFAPLIRKGSKLRLALPEERNTRRLSHPQTEWDLLHGTLLAYREGDIPVARAYMDQHGEGKSEVVRHLLKVWAAKVADEKLRQEAEGLLFGWNLR